MFEEVDLAPIRLTELPKEISDLDWKGELFGFYQTESQVSVFSYINGLASEFRLPVLNLGRYEVDNTLLIDKVTKEFEHMIDMPNNSSLAIIEKDDELYYLEIFAKEKDEDVYNMEVCVHTDINCKDFIDAYEFNDLSKVETLSLLSGWLGYRLVLEEKRKLSIQDSFFESLAPCDYFGSDPIKVMMGEREPLYLTDLKVDENNSLVFNVVKESDRALSEKDIYEFLKELYPYGPKPNIREELMYSKFYLDNQPLFIEKVIVVNGDLLIKLIEMNNQYLIEDMFTLPTALDPNAGFAVYVDKDKYIYVEETIVGGGDPVYHGFLSLKKIEEDETGDLYRVGKAYTKMDYKGRTIKGIPVGARIQVSVPSELNISGQDDAYYRVSKRYPTKSGIFIGEAKEVSEEDFGDIW